MKRALVCGGGGFIGSHISQAAARKRLLGFGEQI